MGWGWGWGGGLRDSQPACVATEVSPPGSDGRWRYDVEQEAEVVSSGHQQQQLLLMAWRGT